MGDRVNVPPIFFPSAMSSPIGQESFIFQGSFQGILSRQGMRDEKEKIFSRMK